MTLRGRRQTLVKIEEIKNNIPINNVFDSEICQQISKIFLFSNIFETPIV